MIGKSFTARKKGFSSFDPESDERPFSLFRVAAAAKQQFAPTIHLDPARDSNSAQRPDYPVVPLAKWLLRPLNKMPDVEAAL